MYIEVTYPFPISLSREKWWGSSYLIRGYDEYVGVMWGEMNTQTMNTQLTFFQVHLLTGNISQLSTHWPVFTDSPQLYYDNERHTWMTCLPFRASIPHAGREIVLYEIRMEQEPWLFPVMQIDTGLLGNQNASLLLMDTSKKRYNMLYFVDNLDEVSDSEVYWATWRTELFSVTNTLPFLAYCDLCMAYATEEHYLLFLCQRVYDQEPKDIQRGAGRWQLGINVYDREAKFVGSSPLLHDDTLRIRDVRFPHKDVVNWLDVRLVVTPGPRIEPQGKQTCVAALVMYEPGELSREEPNNENIDFLHHSPHRSAKYSEQGGRQHGGLFWFDSQGTCLKQGTSTVGKRMSLCCCGERMIGTDLLDGRWRLWSWVPTETTELQEWFMLSSDVKGASVVVQEELQERSFWLIEEYEDRVKVSLRESETGVERTSIWLEGISLPEGPVLAGESRKPMGVVAYDDTLLILGANKQQQLHMFQIRA